MKMVFLFKHARKHRLGFIELFLFIYFLLLE
jgi:hypothetical protein